MGIGRTDQPAADGFRTVYSFQVRDQFNAVLPREVEWNERLGPGIPDFPNPDWPPAAEDGAMVDPRLFVEGYLFNNNMATPGSVNPSHADAAVKVEHQTQDYYIGSIVPGKGVKVKTHILQWHRGYARQV